MDSQHHVLSMLCDDPTVSDPVKYLYLKQIERDRRRSTTLTAKM
jgi:hypothetical protein